MQAGLQSKCKALSIRLVRVVSAMCVGINSWHEAMTLAGDIDEAFG